MRQPKFKSGDFVRYRSKTCVVVGCINLRENLDILEQGYRYYIKVPGERIIRSTSEGFLGVSLKSSTIEL